MCACEALLRLKALDLGDETFLPHHLAEATHGRVWLAASMTYGPQMRQALAERVALARRPACRCSPPMTC